MEEDIYVEVAVPIAQYKTFTYKISPKLYKSLENKALIGRRVLVPFRTTGFTGIVIEKTEKPTYEVKEVEEIPDKEPLFTEKEINVLKKISEYYVSPIGLTVNFFIPDVLNWKKKNGKWIKTVKEEKIYVPTVLTTSGLERLSKKSLELLEFILEYGEITRRDIVEAGFSLNSLKTLLKKGLVKEEKYIFRESTLKETKIPYMKTLHLPKGKYVYGFKKADERLKQYLPLILDKIKKQKGVVIIFPTTKLVEYTYQILREKFGDRVYRYHDGISGKEKIKTWFNLKNYKGSVLIGTFSASFIPVKDVDLYILEEEPSETYKVLRTPRFDTRRIIFELSTEKKASLIYASTVISTEAYFSVKKGIFSKYSKGDVFKKGKSLEVIPLNREKVLTEKIINEIKDAKNTLIIANKKAYASFLYCKKCEEEILCPECNIPLRVYSKPEKYLKCELCNVRYEYIRTCPVCSTELVEIGFGIEKIEEVLKKHFAEQISSLEEKKETPIKLTTNIVDRELLVPEFELVINIYPDFLLNINDFRGNEKFFRNILTGFIKAEKKYILITNSIESAPVVSLQKKNVNLFYENELKIRKEFELPPYTKLILLTFEKKDLTIKKVEEIFKSWLEENRIKDIDFKGPFYAYYSNVRGKIRIQILLKNFKHKEKLKKLYETVSKKGIKLIIDVDPKQIV